MNFLLVLIGIIFLSLGGEALIRGSLGAAKRLNISALMCGIFIIGFGTSAPELVVSINAANNNNSDIAIGNVVGSNIGNILLILGICAVITPLRVKPKVVSRDASTAFLASVLFSFLVFSERLDNVGAFILISALVAYLCWVFFDERTQTSLPAQLHLAEAKEVTVVPNNALLIVITISVGLGLLVYGSQLLLQGAIGIASRFSVSDSTVGLTLVAVGTSLPELSISVIAAFRKHADVAVGNVLGSNIFNVLGILGISSFLQPLTASERVIEFDHWIMLLCSLAVILLLYLFRNISRLAGIIFLVLYFVYTITGFSLYT